MLLYWERFGIGFGGNGEQGMVTRAARRLYRAYRVKGMHPRVAWRTAYRLARCAYNHWWVGSYTMNPTLCSGEENYTYGFSRCPTPRAVAHNLKEN